MVGYFIYDNPLQALRKKQLIADGKLGKFGKILETTPIELKQEFATKIEAIE